MSPKLQNKGRPPKFDEPRRPVTVTLPESTLSRIAALDADRARAIVKLTDAAMPVHAKEKYVELVEVAPGLGLIIVGPSEHLRKIPWLRLVEVAPTRFLLTIPSGTPIDSLELAIGDLLDETTPDEWEYPRLLKLRDLIRKLRRRGEISKGEMLFVKTDAGHNKTSRRRSDLTSRK
jgi:hypothetical protein